MYSLFSMHRGCDCMLQCRCSAVQTHGIKHHHIYTLRRSLKNLDPFAAIFDSMAVSGPSPFTGTTKIPTRFQIIFTINFWCSKQLICIANRDTELDTFCLDRASHFFQCFRIDKLKLPDTCLQVKRLDCTDYLKSMARVAQGSFLHA